MVRNRQHKHVSSRIYRHFAAVTIVCTMVMAVFTDGESRNAAAREVKEAKAAPADVRPVELVRKSNASQGSFSSGDEFDGSFGQPMDGGASDTGGGLPDNLAVVPGSGMPGGFTTYGVSVEVWGKLSAEQKKKLIASYRAEKEAAESPNRQKQMDSLLAASRARSGSDSGSD